jgi:hypothetical protein
MNSKQKETKRERFVRLATRRTNEVMDKLRILGGCANKRMYDYDESDVRKIFRAIDDEVRRVKGLFTEDKKKEFTLGA